MQRHPACQLARWLALSLGGVVWLLVAGAAATGEKLPRKSAVRRPIAGMPTRHWKGIFMQTSYLLMRVEFSVPASAFRLRQGGNVLMMACWERLFLHAARPFLISRRRKAQGLRMAMASPSLSLKCRLVASEGVQSIHADSILVNAQHTRGLRPLGGNSQELHLFLGDRRTQRHSQAAGHEGSKRSGWRQ